jgi:septal ring factor EnvC (AmiA/AmiB activator)
MSWSGYLPGSLFRVQFTEETKRKMTEEDKMQRDYEDMLDSVKIERAKVADRDAEIAKLKKHIESNHEDLRAAKKLRKQHVREIKLLRANVDLLEAEQELYLYDREVDNAKDRQLLARTKVHNLRTRYDNLCDLSNNAES